ncbi:hypothetical protein EV175_007307, partial [Coemansia sp. RSA 1933]
MESFNIRAEELRAKREQEYVLRRSALKKSSREFHESLGVGRNAKDPSSGRGHNQRHSKRSSSRPAKSSRRTLRGANTFSSAERGGSRAWATMRPTMTQSSTFTSADLPDPRTTRTTTGSSRIGGGTYAQHIGMNGVASMSMQDVMLASSGTNGTPRQRTNSAAAETVHGSFVSFSSEGKASVHADEESVANAD